MADPPRVDVRVLPTAAMPAALLDEVRVMVDEAFAGRFSDDDWAHSLGGRHAVVTEAGVLVAHASVVPRVLEVAGTPVRTGYVESVATRPARQGEGWGTTAMRALLPVLHAQHEMGALSTSSHRFYERLGWERWRGPTYVRSDGQQVRTEDEDDGVMALRFGASAAVDLAAAISCADRAGDAW